MSAWRNPGGWLFFAGLEILLMVHLAEFLYPGYSVSQNYISDLGVGPEPSSTVFAVGLVVFGAMVLVSAYLLRERRGWGRLWVLFVLAGVGAIGVGLFNEHTLIVGDTPVAHSISALLAFLFGNVAAIYSMRFTRSPFSYLSVLLGVIGLLALFLLLSGRVDHDLLFGIGEGGMERMIFYPPMFWVLGMGAYFIARGDNWGNVDRT